MDWLQRCVDGILEGYSTVAGIAWHCMLSFRGVYASLSNEKLRPKLQLQPNAAESPVPAAAIRGSARLASCDKLLNLEGTMARDTFSFPP